MFQARGSEVVGTLKNQIEEALSAQKFYRVAELHELLIPHAAKLSPNLSQINQLVKRLRELEQAPEIDCSQLRTILKDPSWGKVYGDFVAFKQAEYDLLQELATLTGHHNSLRHHFARIKVVTGRAGRHKYPDYQALCSRLVLSDVKHLDTQLFACRIFPWDAAQLQALLLSHTELLRVRRSFFIDQQHGKIHKQSHLEERTKIIQA